MAIAAARAWIFEKRFIDIASLEFATAGRAARRTASAES
jgi:hypothetical protein